ncbi:MAG: DUF1048 domain-containing protein [Gordonibacter sp.]|uniref:DUF1048 domain-containing protein n=1 Tax=Gordonibacter sp. TaxID=1968902 RepID=UPI002FC62DB8
MATFIQKMIEDKKEYKGQMARAEVLPEDYRFVFKKIHAYIWGKAAGDGSDMIEAQGALLDLFEAGSAEGRQVLEVTGRDVAGFADEFVRDIKQWTDAYRNRLNRAVSDKVEKGGAQ